MREAIRKRLMEEIPEINEQCFEPHAAGPDVNPPYLVVRQGVDTEESSWVGFRQIVEVWSYVKRTSFSEVDKLNKKVIKALDQQLITTDTGEVFSCLYQGSVGGDDVAEQWDALTRGLRFAVIAIHHIQTPDDLKGDPWIEAAAKWAENVLGEEWTVYRDILPLGYQRPALLLRLGSLDTQQRNRTMFEVRKQVVGHFFGNNAQEQLLGAAGIVEELANAIKIPLSIEEKRYLTVQTPRLNANANAVTNGQLNVTFTRTTSRIREEVTPIREIHSRLNLH